MTPIVPIVPHQLDMFRRIIYREMGIRIPREKDYLLSKKIADIMRVGKFQSVSHCLRLLKERDPVSIHLLAQFITTNHTFFFREKDHFQFMVEDIKKRQIPEPLIWCAASSSGEEAYSIAIYLLENGFSQFFILASDIKREVLVQLKQGIYPPEKVIKLSRYVLEKYFARTEYKGREYFRVKEILKHNMAAKKLNLMDNLEFEKKFHYIFCRNVLIYFDKQSQISVIRTLRNNLDPEGFLFTGHSESLLGMGGVRSTKHAAVYRSAE